MTPLKRLPPFVPPSPAKTRTTLRDTCIGVALTCSAFAAASPAAAQVTYQVDRTIGQGSVVGTIQTDGKSGVLAPADILSWNLKLTGAGGASVTLTSVGGASANPFVGGDVSVSSNKLLFNFSGTDGGYFAFQANPGVASGNKYWCNAVAAGACAKGDSVVPENYASPSAQYMDETGLQVLGLGGPLISERELLLSLLSLMEARQRQMITNNLFSSVLLGFNEQVSCGNCGGADVTFGSFSLGAHGRRSLTKELTLLGGASLGQFNEAGARVRLSATIATALRYDPSNMGSTRPFFELGVSGSPYQTTVYSRPYTFQSASSAGVGQGETHSSTWNVYGRAGYVSRVTPRDELAVSLTASHTWQVVKGYSEAVDPINNPFGATFGGGADQMTVLGLGAQYTRLVSRYVEAGVTAGIERSVDPTSGIAASITNVGSTPTPGARAQTWAVYGGRLGVRFTRRLTADAFIDGVSGPAGIGTSVHGGGGFRLAF